MPDKPHRVLVIDDDPRLIQVIADSLRLFGAFDVFTAANGIQGLEKCILERPDVAIVDVRMPGLDGYQLIRALRGDQTTADIPLIILSAMVEEKDKFSGIISGADIYLEKPVMPQQLVDAINQAIYLTQAEREAKMRRMADE